MTRRLPDGMDSWSVWCMGFDDQCFRAFFNIRGDAALMTSSLSPPHIPRTSSRTVTTCSCPVLHRLSWFTASGKQRPSRRRQWFSRSRRSRGSQAVEDGFHRLFRQGKRAREEKNICWRDSSPGGVTMTFFLRCGRLLDGWRIYFVDIFSLCRAG